MVSVVIPFYNSKESISYCLDSVLSQTYNNFEILLVDDGSSDGTDKFIIDYFVEKKFNRYRIFYQKNSGPGIARKLGILNSCEEYIAFIDSDDVWKPDHLKLLMNKIQETKADFVCTTHDEGKCKVEKELLLKNLIYKNYVLSSTVLARRRIFEKCSFRDGKRYSEDYDLWLRLCAEGYKMIYLPVSDVHNYKHKMLFGSSGLSSKLWDMEKNELENFFFLYKNKNISLKYLVSSFIYSICKYCRRWLISR